MQRSLLFQSSVKAQSAWLTDISSFKKKHLFNNFSAVCFFSPSTEIKLDQQVVQSRRWKRIPFVTTLQSYRDLKMFSLLFRVELRPYILNKISQNLKTLKAVSLTLFASIVPSLALFVIDGLDYSDWEA